MVDDDAALRTLLTLGLKGRGFEIVGAADAGEAIAAFRSFAPSVTLLDLALPDRDGLSVLAEMREIDPGAAVIIITGRGDEESALRAGAASFVRKPFALPDLARKVRQLAAWRSVPAPALAKAHGPHRLSLGTAEARDPAVVAKLTLPLQGLLDEAGLLGVRVGIGEMIANAVEHGNLGISAEEKEEALARGRYDGLLAARLAAPANAAKKVRLEWRLGGGELVVTVRDEGEGFDWRALAAAEPGATLAGRGVLLARAYFDEVRWNDRGNEVTLVKRIPGAT